MSYSPVGCSVLREQATKWLRAVAPRSMVLFFIVKNNRTKRRDISGAERWHWGSWQMSYPIGCRHNPVACVRPRGEAIGVKGRVRYRLMLLIAQRGCNQQAIKNPAVAGWLVTSSGSSLWWSKAGPLSGPLRYLEGICSVWGYHPIYVVAWCLLMMPAPKGWRVVTAWRYGCSQVELSRRRSDTVGT